MFDRRNGIIERAGYTLSPQTTGVLASDAIGRHVLSKQTTDDTPVEVALLAPSSKRALAIKAKISAVVSDGSAGACWEISAAVLSNGTATLSLLGATSLSAEASAAFAPTAEINVSGANVVAILTGVAATTINWLVEFEVA